MKASIIAAAAAITGAASATTKAASATTGSYSAGSTSQSLPFIPASDQYVLFADNIQTVSQQLPDTAGLRSTNEYVITPFDLGTASSFTIPNFAYGAQCSLNLAVPSFEQVGGDTDVVVFSGSGSLNFSVSLTDLPDTGLTFNTLFAGGIHSNGDQTVTAGQLLNLANFPCPQGGTVFPGLISSPAYGADTTLTLKNSFGPFGVTGFFIVIDGISNPPVSPSSGSASYGSSSYYATPTYSYAAGASGYGSSSAPDSYATYTSAWHS